MEGMEGAGGGSEKETLAPDDARHGHVALASDMYM